MSLHIKIDFSRIPGQLESILSPEKPGGYAKSPRLRSGEDEREDTNGRAADSKMFFNGTDFQVTVEGRLAPNIKVACNWIIDAISPLAKKPQWAPLVAVVQGADVLLQTSEAYFAFKQLPRSDRGVKGTPEKRTPEKPYRDHLIHPATFTVLGYKVLVTATTADGDAAVEKTLADSLADSFFRSKIGLDALAFGGLRKEDVGPEAATRLLLEAWKLAGVSHDVGYMAKPAMEILGDFSTLLRKARNPDLAPSEARGYAFASSELHWSLVKRLDEAEGALAPSEQDLIRKYFLSPAKEALRNDALKKQREGKREDSVLDHGQFLACHWIELYLFRQECLLDKNDRVVLFLILLATFRHDQWSKTETESKLFVEEGRDDQGIDLWTNFFCLIDLLAEIRLIWDKPEPKPRETDNRSTSLVVGIWLPFETILLKTDLVGSWSIIFERSVCLRNPDRWERGNFLCASSTGDERVALAGDENDKLTARAKKTQYETLLRTLGLLHSDVDVVCS